MLRVLRVLEFQFQQAVDVQGHGVIVRVPVLGCCFMARWACDAGVRGTCGGRCGVVRRGRRAVWRGCGVWLHAGGCPGRWCCPCVRFGLWPVVGVELARGVRGFQGWCRWGGVRSRRGVASFLCWWAVVSRAPGWGRGVRCGMVVLCCVVASLLGGGGHRVQVWWGGLSPVVCPLAVWGSPAWSLDRSPGVFQYVACAGSVWHRAWGSLGRGVRDWSVATRGVWSCGAWGCRPAVGWARWCGALRLRGPRAGGSRLLGRVVAPVRCPRVVSGGVWLGCIVSTVGGGLFARVWGGPVVGCRRVAGVGAALWVGIPRRPLGASRGGLWSAG